MIPPASNVLAVFVGGMIGALLRVGFVLLFPIDPTRFPLTTFCENVIGAFVLGAALVVLLERWRTPGRLHPFLCTGILGSFTTFSNLSVEIVELVGHGRETVALAYALGSVMVGLAAAWMGMTLARRWPVPIESSAAEAGEGAP